MRDVSEGILEDLRARQIHNLIGKPVGVDERNFIHDLQNVLFGVRIIMSPAVTLPPGAVPPHDGELLRGILFLKNTRSDAKPLPLSLEKGCSQQSHHENQK